MSSDDDVGRRYRSCDDGESRWDIKVDDSRSGSRSKETNHFYSCSIGEAVGGDGRVRYRYQTSHSSSNDSGGHDILLIIHECVRGDIRGDNTRRGSRSQDIIHYYF